MEFLFKSRGAGKRQVKPSQDIDMLADQMAGNQGDGSSDDSDFKLDDKSSDDDDESDSDDEVCLFQKYYCLKYFKLKLYPLPPSGYHVLQRSYLNLS